MNSDEDSVSDVGVFDNNTKNRKIDEIAEEIDFEYPDIP